MGKNELTILIVDDKPANILVLTELLEKQDRLFFTATNGHDALKIALNKELDLIILDVQMPDMDGFEVAQILKSNKKTKEIPIIFASAEKKEHEFIMKGFEEGAVDYLFKPLNAEITKAKVSVLLKIQMQKKELLEKNERIKSLNDELQESVLQLKSINSELESFSYSVSHDLRAPLRAINGYSQILKEDYSDILNNESLEILNDIQQNAIKMNRLIEDLLEFSRLGRKELQKTEVDMTDLVNKTISDINKSTAHKTDIKLPLLLPAYGDLMLLAQVWINLISNAIKYSSKKENPVVEITSYKENDHHIYSIKDNGTGFDMAYASKLFGVFQRLHGTDEFEGTGIGLAIIQRIIVRHGGKVWADARVEEGATFNFSLPVRKID